MAAIITLLIILAILSLIAVFLLLRVTLTVKYDGEAALVLRVLFVKKRLYPKKKKRYKKSMSAKKAQKIKEKLRKKKEKKLEKKRQKAESKKQDGKKASPTDILNTIQTVCIIVSQLIEKFSKYLKIKIAKIHITVATGDAAQTAIAYGAITQGINVLFPLLEDVKNFSMPKNQDIKISHDFLSEDSEMDLCLVFSLRVWQILLTAISVLYKLTIHSIKALERKERKNHGK